MKRKMNRKKLAEEYQLKDIAWALKQKKGKKTKKPKRKIREE